MLLAFRALQISNEQRNAYGLRYNDVTRYRKHCANRTHRLRSTLKITHGKGKDFKKLPTFTQDNVKDGHLQLLLFEAERAWAYAQELIKLSLMPENEQIASSLRHSATGRFRRAVHWSTQLLSLCHTLHASSKLSVENLIEVTVYTLIINGRFLRYRDEFIDGLIQLCVARSLLGELEKASSTSRDQALAVQFSDDISPEIRYCAHELGHSKAYDIDGIVAELAPKHRNEVVENCDALLLALKSSRHRTSGDSKLEERIWDGQPVPVRYPELVDVLIRVQHAERYLDIGTSPFSHIERSKLGETPYDDVLSALSDAEGVARKLQESHQLTGVNIDASTGVRDIYFVHAYIVYHLLARRIQRDLLLMNTLLSSGGTGRPKDFVMSNTFQSVAETNHVDNRLYPAVVKLLDTILQSLTQMRSLSIVDDSPDLALAVEARITIVNAQRCLYLAQCYKATKKFPEALTLLHRATIYIRETTSSSSLSESDLITNGNIRFFPLNSGTIKELENSLFAEGVKHKRDWFAYNRGSATLDPTAYEKPLFFNIALNYVELDIDTLHQRAGKASNMPAAVTNASSTAKAEGVEKKPAPKAKADVIPQPIPVQQAPARSGLSSLLGGWWSR